MNCMIDEENRPKDRHKPGRMIRLPKPLCDLLEQCVQEEPWTTLTEQVRNAVVEYLVRRRKLPRGPDVD